MVGPVYTTQNNQMAGQLEMVSLRGDVETLSSKLDGLTNEFLEKQCVSHVDFARKRDEFDRIHELFVDKIGAIEAKMQDMEEDSNGMKLSVIGANMKLTKVLQ